MLLAMTGAFGCMCVNDTGSGGSNPEACTALDQCHDDSPDIVALSAQWMDLRGNVAVGGNQFVFGGASYSNVIGNSVTISSPPAPAECWPGSDCSAAMWLTAKELLLLDNTFNTPAGIPAVAEDAQGHDGRRFVTSGGNTYNGPSASFLMEPSFPGNPDLAILDLGDNAYGTTKTVTAVLPATPPASGRVIYTIVPDDPAYPDLVAQINDKANHPGAVVYFPAGTYMLNDTITIQGGTDVIIAGDGPNTLIIWNGTQPDKWAFDVLAPARASFRDLMLVANANSTQPLPGGIRVRTDDGPGGMVYGEQVYLGALTGVEMAGVDNTAARFEQLEAGGEVGVRVTGGGAAALDRSKTRGLVAYGGGATAFTGVASIASYGKVVLEGQDFEGDSQAATFDQPGYFTTAGGRYHTANLDTHNSNNHTSYPPAPNFSGTARDGAFAFLNATSNAGVYFSQSSANVLALGLEYGVAGLAPRDITPGTPPSGQLLPPVDMSFPVNAHLYDQVACGDIALAPESVAQGQQMSLANQIAEYCGDNSQCPGPISFDCQNATAQSPDEAAFVASMLADLRAGSVAPRSVCGETDVRIHRIFSPGVFGALVPGSDPHAYSNRALTTAIRIGP
jgi:hypothetical protein